MRDLFGPCLDCGQHKKIYYPMFIGTNDKPLGVLCHECEEKRRG